MTANALPSLPEYRTVGNAIVGAFGPPTLAHLISVALQRLPRQNCHGCRKRRVLFVLTVYGEPRGAALCAICAGLRG